MGIFKLRDRLGMKSYDYPSQVFQKLAPAVKELVERGYLEGMSREKDANGAPMTVFRFGKAELVAPPPKSAPKPSQASPTPQSPPTLAFQELRELRELPDLATVLPAWDAPSSADYNDPAGAQLDALFESLPPDEKADIDAQIKASLPAMLRDFSARALRDFGTGARARGEMLDRYPGAARPNQ